MARRVIVTKLMPDASFFKNILKKINPPIVSYENFPTFDCMNSSMEKNEQKFEPTKAELEILQVLWQHGPSTVRFVNDKLNEQRDVNYTSTLKLMQIMADKGILKRDESQMKHIYHVAEAEEKTKDHLVNRFVDTMYQGSTGKLVMQLLGNKKTSKEDLKAIRNMLDKLDKD
jgi:BlaI family transcriptional regulator, penicillinase repressor